MFELSSKTQVNRKFKLTELYKVMGADKTVKADAANVLSVTLTNVLNNDTLNFSAKGEVKEIYLFEIVLDTKTVPSLFISSLDKATNFHTAFILRCGSESMVYGAFKEYGEKGMKIGKYYSTDWAAEKLMALPLGVNSLDGIYTAIIKKLIPIATRQTESTKDFVARYGEVVKLKKEIEKLQHLVDNEKQSKRRFELNDKLKQKKKELENLG
ncbi:MAG: DUF4391 domain-containing protein [Treponemataceae bacterium]|nr:DUF4391 domain-containing protein [Treponemataceae bacterium]